MDNASAATSPAGKGGGSVPEAAPRLRARQVQPGEGFSLILPTSFFFKALQLVLFPTNSGEDSSFFSRLLPGARPRGAAGGGKAGCGRLGRPDSGSCGYLAARARAMAVVVRGPRRAQSRVSLTPAPRPPRRRLASPLAGGGGVLFRIQRIRAKARAAPAATSPPSSHPWVKGIFPWRLGDSLARRRRRGWCRR